MRAEILGKLVLFTALSFIETQSTLTECPVPGVDHFADGAFVGRCGWGSRGFLQVGLYVLTGLLIAMNKLRLVRMLLAAALFFDAAVRLLTVLTRPFSTTTVSGYFIVELFLHVLFSVELFFYAEPQAKTAPRKAKKTKAKKEKAAAAEAKVQAAPKEAKEVKEKAKKQAPAKTASASPKSPTMTTTESLDKVQTGLIKSPHRPKNTRAKNAKAVVKDGETETSAAPAKKRPAAAINAQELQKKVAARKKK